MLRRVVRACVTGAAAGLTADCARVNVAEKFAISTSAKTTNVAQMTPSTYGKSPLRLLTSLLLTPDSGVTEEVAAHFTR
jgi:hypothetical protein